MGLQQELNRAKADANLRLKENVKEYKLSLKDLDFEYKRLKKEFEEEKQIIAQDLRSAIAYLRKEYGR
jgi:hypothetical protein